MKKSSTKKRTLAPENNTTSGADFVWAAVTIVSLPISALSISSLGIHPALSFLLGALITFLVFVVEVITRGKSWIFSDRFHEIFGHQETAFRILVVIGGALLILQTAFVIQLLISPQMDTVLFNLILQKQCQKQQGPLTDLICPAFTAISPGQLDKIPLTYSLEQASKDRLLPNAVFSSCAIAPFDNTFYQAQKLDVKFFAFCRAWGNNSLTEANEPVLRLISATVEKDSQGYYSVLTWQEDKSSEEFQRLINDQKLLLQLNNELVERYGKIIRMYAF